MGRSFDTTFIAGSALVLAALAVSFLALTREDLPIIGVGRGALIAVALLGMAGCAVAGISQAPVLGWSAPSIVLGASLGIVALVIVASGLLGWDAMLAPIAGFVPNASGTVSAARTAIVGLAFVIAVKWVIATGLLVTAG